MNPSITGKLLSLNTRRLIHNPHNTRISILRITLVSLLSVLGRRTQRSSQLSLRILRERTFRRIRHVNPFSESEIWLDKSIVSILSQTRVGRSARQLSKRFVRRLRNHKPDLPGLPDVDRVHHIESRDGIKLKVNDLGPEDASTVMLFAHGFTLTSNSWFFQAKYLRTEHPDVRLLLPDLRGHGDSSVLINSGGGRPEPAQLGVAETSKDLLEILDHLVTADKNLVLVGHSMGVMTVLGALRLMQPQLRSRVTGVILINGAIDRFASDGITQILDSPPVRVLRKIGKTLPAPAHLAKDGMEWIIKPVIAGFVYHGALEEGDSDKFDIVDFHADEIDSTSMGTILGYLDDLATHDETAAAPLLAGIPGVVMVGACDDVTPAEQTRKIGALWPGAEVVEFPDSGHMLPVECPEAVNEAIGRVLAQSS
ncbi:alpha/beta fold hydrolase [Corynebacterium sp. zg254]|uniref:Alpha/beta hydrolase n=1 Tax=Corynebacterium zhongnanshanii TaxID=2768834 RepID=A0ABQ6VD94_9CORY|nr:alpha/beta hydrolase [Corynebacterium zhongnanshanii]MCR5914508.1 alpha/beta fold hydrolase [Corynebacterium sp. zg254]